MCFRSTLNIILASILGMSAAGCSEYINGEKKKPEVIEVSNAKFKCLQGLPAQLKDLSVGEAQTQDIEEAFACLNMALTYFNDNTFGSVQGGYTVEEIRRFFGRYFLKQNNVTPELALELMNIKKALVGGNSEHLTKNEIVALMRVMNIIKEELKLLAPHIKILLSQGHQKQAAWEEITAATEQLRRSGKRILEGTQIPKSDYSFEDAKKVLAGLASFIQGGEAFAPYDKYSQWLPLVEAVKNVLVGRRPNFTGVAQWNDNLDSFVDLYELLLKYHYNLRSLNFEDQAKLRQISQFVGKTLSLITNSHQMGTLGYIPARDIDELLDLALPKLGLGLQPASAKKVYRAILLKMLDPVRKDDTRGFLGLELKHLATLQREFNIWRLSQSFIDSMPLNDATPAISQAKLLEAFKSFDKNYVIERGLTGDPYEQQALRTAWDDYGQLLAAPMPVVYNSMGQMFISVNTAALGQTWKSLSQANLMKFISRMLMTGYGENVSKALSVASIKQQGLVEWYDDFKEFFLDIGAFDPRSGNSGGRSFLEANFFTFSGNGDDLMNQAETYEFVSTLFAAGLGTSARLQADVTAVCALPEKDLFGKPFLNQDCFSKELRARVATHLSNLPGLVKFVKSLTNDQWNEFFTYLLAASATKDQKPGYIDTANVRTLVTILHYQESLMALYDTDKNNTLSLSEVYAATPRFMSFLKTVSPDVTNETLLSEGFAYLVFKAAIPKGAADLAGFQLSKMLGLGEASHMNIIRIFGTLKDQLNKPEK